MLEMKMRDGIRGAEASLYGATFGRFPLAIPIGEEFVSKIALPEFKFGRGAKPVDVSSGV